ncbi:folylpolyglutamate synthase/dihydrofolate synthase family protein [Nocardiopsis lucentensis]|uniref:hypothetical protein n=1 Tax=Nocardiopsis lucentensis TaxID=53441 RepID=UPI000346BF5A|nr:hypothetical protein [Nocardiopsis lucentensis]
MRTLDPFFTEWARKRPGQTRSRERARLLMAALDLDPAAVPVLGVVGSKGKGSTATYASAALSAAGLRTVLCTGPSFRSYRERVRVDGVSLTNAELDALGARVESARLTLPPVEATGGHLAPSGLFLIAALLRAREVGADVCVLEAGAGGYRDELRVIGPDVVALGKVFGEHLGVLGDTVPEIAGEKARVAGDRTRALVSLPQTAEVTDAVADALVEATGGRVVAEIVDPGAEGVEPPVELRPAGLSAASGVLGTAAALRMLDVLGRPRPPRERLREVLGTVRLPARLSRHRVPGSGSAEIVVDSAINGEGVAAALAHARTLWGGVDHVLLCLPDHKDVSGAVAALGDVPVTTVVLPETHLRFEHALPPHWRTMRAEELSPGTVAALGDRLLAMGTVYFTGRVLEAVDAPTDRLFDPLD